MAPRSAHNLAVAAYAQRGREAGHTRTNVVLSPDDMASIGRLMKVWGVSRQEAMRSAIRFAAKAVGQPGVGA